MPLGRVTRLSFWRQLLGLPSCMGYLTPQGVLLPLVYGTTASPLWLELRGLSAWQATPCWTVYRLACHWLLPWLQVRFAMVPDAAWSGSDQQPWGTAPAAGPVGWLGRPSAPEPCSVVCCFPSLGHPTCARVCGVLGHLAPVHQCPRSMRCGRCPGRLGACSLVCPLGSLCCVCGVLIHCSCSPVCSLGALCCVCGVLGHLAPIHRYARSVCCVACAVSCATWLLFTAVITQFLCCVCVVHGHLAPVHRCAGSVRCLACAVSWATGLLFTGVLDRCAVLRLWCPGPPGSCSPVCLLGASSCVCGVLGHLAPVHRCAHLVCYVACAERRYRTRTPRSGQRCLVARRGWVCCRARTRPSGRRLFRSRQGLGLLSGAQTSIRTAAGVAWHLFLLRGSLRVVCAVRVCGTRWTLLLGTCPCAFVVASGVPLWRAPWPCVVRRPLSSPVTLGTSVSSPDAVVPFPNPGPFAPQFTGRLRGAREGRPRTGLIVPAAGPAEAGALGLLCIVPVQGPAKGLCLAAPSGVSLGLRALLWFACVDLLTHASGFRTVCRRTRNSAGESGLFRVDADTSPFGSEDDTHGFHVCSRVRALLGRVGQPASRARFGAPHFSFGRLFLLPCFVPSGMGLPLSCPFVCLPPFLSGIFFFYLPLRPRCLLLALVSRSGCPGPWRSVAPPPPPVYFPVFLAACFVWCLFPPGLLFLPQPFFFAFCPLVCGASPCFVVGFCALCGVLWGGYL